MSPQKNKFISPVFLKIETDFDSRTLTKETFKDWPQIQKLITSYDLGNWEAVEFQFRDLWAYEQKQLDVCRLAFLLQWWVGASEICYDLTSRTQAMRFWNDIENWAAAPYAQYLRSFQEGVGFFFSGALFEAQRWFRKSHQVAKKMNYPRGEMRSLFHLGLVARDQNETESALKYFKSAHDISIQLNAWRFKERIVAEIGYLSQKNAVSESVPLDAHGSFQLIRGDLEKSMFQKDWIRARRRLVDAERLRRKFKLGRRAESLYLYLAVLLEMRGRKVGRILGRKIDDPVLRAKWLLLRRKVCGEDVSLESEEQWRKEHTFEEPKVCGMFLSQVPREDVRSLIKILMQSSEPVSKEKICRILWGVQYDPAIHDGRLYKLFYHSRKFFNKKDLFLNRYGSYTLNRGRL